MAKTFPALIVASALAAGAGVGAAKLAAPQAPAAASRAGSQEAAAGGHGGASAGAHGGDKAPKKDAGHGAAAAPVEGILPLPPIVSALRAPSHVWVRFEGSLVVDSMDGVRARTLAAEVADDASAYFTALTLPEIEGGVGLKSVREDLLERARMRGGDKVRELLVQTLVAQ